MNLSARDVIFFAALCYFMSFGHVHLETGTLSRMGIGTASAAICLSPVATVLAVLAASALDSLRDRSASTTPLRILGPPGWAFYGSSARWLVLALHGDPVTADIAGIIVTFLSNWTATALVARAVLHRPFRTIYRKNFTREWYAAFAYFGLAALLIKNVLDGSVRGYILATIVAVLSLALTDTLSGRRENAALQAQLTDADRHLMFSRLVEGVVHNLRNHIWAAQGYLEEVDKSKLPPEMRHDIETAEAAARDAAANLRDLSTGAAPRVNFSSEPVNLNEIARHAVALVRNRARDEGIQVRFDNPYRELPVRADPLLLREVLTNLLTNALDAVAARGNVTITSGYRGESQVYVSVADNGPGISDVNRPRLFEPHFTTKPHGNGIGLFTSYGIVREHRGKLLYEGEPGKGAIFTVVLPLA